MIKRAIRAVVHRLLGIDRVRWLVQAELAARRPAAPAPPRSDVEGMVFTDRAGVDHPLDPELRGRLKPQWRTMCDPIAVASPPTDEVLAGRARKAASSVAEAARLVAAATGRPLVGRILEIGCYDGAAAFQLALGQATEVVASDLARYYVVQRPGEPTASDVAAQEVVLAGLRERARAVAGAPPGRVEFVEDDITSSRLESGSFDAIVSFEVLEHVQRPDAAFAAMARLLRPGGVSYHDYNPFFSVNGGHSLCTLDFPWGHARLDPADFERYLREIRPTEVEQGLRFYRESLNRMTLADLRTAVEGAGLELLGLVPWTDRTLVPTMTPEILAEVTRTYPGAAPEDLLATFVSVIVRRPAEPAPS
jgi:SAM-dependent methyltransferase